MTGLLDRVRPETAKDTRRRWWRAGALVAAGLIVVLWLVAFSPVFGVRTVKVEGTHSVSRARVLKVADVPHGRPLVRLDEAAIVGRVERIKSIKSVSVSVSFPSTVVIRVVERQAVGMVVSPSGAVSLVDAENVVFETVRNAPTTLPTLTLYGDDRDDAITTVAGQLPGSLRAQVALIDAASPEGVTLHLRDGRTIMWGGTDRAGEKTALMKVLLGQPGSYFDLSDPGSVISRGAPTTAPTN